MAKGRKTRKSKAAKKVAVEKAAATATKLEDAKKSSKKQVVEGQVPEALVAVEAPIEVQAAVNIVIVNTNKVNYDFSDCCYLAPPIDPTKVLRDVYATSVNSTPPDEEAEEPEWDEQPDE